MRYFVVFELSNITALKRQQWEYLSRSLWSALDIITHSKKLTWPQNVMALLPLNKQTFNIVPERSGLTEKKNWTSIVAQG